MRKKVILLTLALVLVAGGAIYAWSRRDEQPQASTDSPESFINYNPPTEEEQQAGDEQKKDVGDKEEQPPEEGETKKTAQVIITDAAQYGDVIEVRSFIQNHYEDGTCIITFRRNDQTVTKETPAYRDASTTICTNPLFKRSEFPAAGDWRLTVAYEATKAGGQSETKTVTIR